jgi:hypothetical protein
MSTTYTAAIAPTTSPVLGNSWGFPLPCPLKLYRGATTGIVVANKLHVRVCLVEIRVGLKLFCYEIVQVSRSGRKQKG